jgi:hypothetical protein
VNFQIEISGDGRDLISPGIVNSLAFRRVTPDDLREIESAASKITVQGARYPEKLEQMTGR